MSICVGRSYASPSGRQVLRRSAPHCPASVAAGHSSSCRASHTTHSHSTSRPPKHFNCPTNNPSRASVATAVARPPLSDIIPQQQRQSTARISNLATHPTPSPAAGPAASKTTVTRTAPDDPLASLVDPTAPHSGTTAVVIGCGMGGIAAAQALSPHFERVVVLEADAPQDTCKGSLLEVDNTAGNPRPGVGQYRNLHVLLARGAAELEGLAPGYCDALEAAGALRVEFFKDVRFGTPPGPFATVSRPSQPVPIMQASRHLLEATLRSFIARNPKIHIAYNTRASGLRFSTSSTSSTSTSSTACSAPVTGKDGSSLHESRIASEDDDDAPDDPYPCTDSRQQQKLVKASSASSAASTGRRVVGVRLADGRSLSADLVVAAAGRRAKVSEWLVAEGWPAVPVSVVSVNSAYTTWLLKMSQEVEASLPYLAVYESTGPPYVAAGAYLTRYEGGVWMVSDVSFNRQAPRATVEDGLAWMKGVYSDEVYRLVKDGTAMGPVRTFGGLGNTWSHFEQVPPPDGLIVMGDAYCTFNPIYAQGMTVAAMQARILGSLMEQRLTQHSTNTASSSSSTLAGDVDQQLQQHRAATAAAVSGLAAAFYPAAAAVVGSSWLLAAGRDLLFPFAAVQGEARGVGWRLLQEYVGGIFKVAPLDEETSEVAGRVLNMLDEPTALFKPSIVAKVAAHMLLGWPWDKALRARAAWHTAAGDTAAGSVAEGAAAAAAAAMSAAVGTERDTVVPG